MEYVNDLAQAALTQLTRLHMESLFGPDALQHISCLVRLQELRLCDVHRRPDHPDAVLRGLGQLQQLTALRLKDAQLDLRKQPEDGPKSLSSLQVLRLVRVQGIDPALLHSMRKLRTLQLQSTPLLGSATRADRTAVLLAALPRLQQLQQLFLDHSQLEGLIPDLRST